MAPAALAAFMPSMITSGVVGDSAAKMPPLWNQRTPPAKISLPIEVAGLQPPGRFVRAVVEYHRARARHGRGRCRPWPYSASYAVVLEMLVERLDAHGPHAFGDKVADRIIYHRGRDAGLHRKQSDRLAAQLNSPPLTWIWHSCALRKGMMPRVQAMHQRAEGQEIERALRGDVESVFHAFLPLEFLLCIVSPRRNPAAAVPVQLVWKNWPRGLSMRS